MLNLQDKMIELSAYNVGCRIEGGYCLISVTFDDNWKVIPPENVNIECAERNNITYYCAPVNEVSFDEIFKSIYDTIDYNTDLEKKIILFREKVDELQKIFAEEDINVLKTITFKYKKKRSKKNEVLEKEQNEDINETTDNMMENNNENKMEFVEEIER